ncbi:hypothetical protein ACHAXT_009698 [Thalassiosira profunda]
MAAPSAAVRAYLQRQYDKVASGFASLSRSPPELWKAYALKFLDSYAYFSFALVFTLFLSDDFGLFTGTVIDKLGVATCLRIGFVLSFLTRVAIFATTSKEILLVCLLITLPFSNCLGIPVLTVGIRRYTTDTNRGFAFGLFYVVMNVGALVAGPLVDALTIYFHGKNGDGGEGNGEADTANTSSEWVMTPNRAIILSGVLANFIAVGVAFSVREIKVGANEKQESSKESRPGSLDNKDASKSNVSQFQLTKGSSYQILSETIREPNFRRFLVVCLLTINVRMVFRHLDGTLPKYMIREFGENTPKGKVYAINPAMIIVLVPVVTAATTSVDPLVMIHYGTYVSALSVFFLAFSTSLSACVLFVITLSIGEAIWSPRLYDYTMTVAKEGREGTYMALSSAPLFLAKLPVGFLSGLLLQRYCPEHLEEGQVRHSKTMWRVIGSATIVSPILITLLWGYISGGSEGRARGSDTMTSNGETSMEESEQLLVDSSEHSYQHKPLTTNISLPKVRTER